ncbi:hypothetical protein EDD99_4225 [Streptomyces sp. 846.5]|nr:hypothetical protein [Streptomyces sp. 846.5]TDU05694.1 hypothetical protein EDD99_4225 [Streptomyces sp. 846.5]
MQSLTRRVSTLAVATAVATAGLAVCSTAASAKSDLGISVGSRTTTVGGPVRVQANGNSDDFGGATVRICIDEQVGRGAWSQLACGPQGRRLQVKVKAGHRGTIRFRAQLIALTGPHHHIVDRTSAPVAVQVR